MKLIAPAKINLMLQFTGRRADGYHLMQSAVAFADIGDEIDITPANTFSLVVDGPFAHQAPAGDDNLVTRAAAGAPIAVTLTKNVPAGAGLGGGSADAAAILKYLNTPDRALSLGADVPVSMMGSATWMEGIGEILSPLSMDPMHAVLVWPGQGLSTPDMYRAYAASAKPFHDPVLIPGRIDLTLLTQTENDFTHAAIARMPGIAYILRDLMGQPGAVLSRLSGSGSACFGLYETAADTKKAAEVLSAAFPDAWVKPCVLS